MSRARETRGALHRGYGASLITPFSRRVELLVRKFPNSSRANQKYPPRKEKFLRKNQVKLRKNHIISPKNLPISSGEKQKYLPSYWVNSSRANETSSGFYQALSLACVEDSGSGKRFFSTFALSKKDVRTAQHISKYDEASLMWLFQTIGGAVWE